MFEFFVALIGGGFLAGKYISEKSKLNAAQSERARCDAAHARFVELTYADVRDYQRITELVEDPINWDRVCNLLDEELKSAFGTYFGDTNYRDEFKHNYWNVFLARYLLLAKEGKVDYMNHAGFELGGEKDIRLSISIYRELEKVLNNYLKEHGMTIRLVVLEPPGTPLYGKRIKFEHTIPSDIPRRRLW